MPANRFRLPYSKRIIAYCETNGIAIPVGFHARHTYRFAVVDTGASPPKLLAVTSCMERDVIAQLTAKRNRGKSFRIFDFKCGRELAYAEGKYLTEIGRFSCELPNELKYLVEA